MTGGSSLRRRVSQFVKGLGSVALIALLLSKTSLSDLGSALHNASPGLLGLGLSLGIGAALMQVTQWRGLLAAVGLPRTWRRCLHLELAGDTFDAALPSSVGGDVIRVLVVSEHPDERPRAATAILLRRACNLPGLDAILLVGLLLSWHVSYAHRIRPYGLIALAVTGAAAALVLTPPLAALLRHSIMARMRVASPAGKLADALAAVRGNRRAQGSAFVRGLGFWTLVVASQYTYMRALNIHAPVAYAAVVVTTVNALSLLPISLGGYGLREGAFAGFLAVGGLATVAQGAAVGLCLTAQTLMFGLVGLPFFLTLGSERRGARRQLSVPEALPS